MIFLRGDETVLKKLFWILILILFSNGYTEECAYTIGENEEMIISTNDEFGCEYDNRDIKKLLINEKLFEFEEDQDSDLVLKYNGAIFDKFKSEGFADTAIRDVIFIDKYNVFIILYGNNVFVEEANGIVAIDAAFYNINLYQLENGLLSPILLTDDKKEKLSGFEGLYYGKYKRYPFKLKTNLVEYIALMIDGELSHCDLSNHMRIDNSARLVQLQEKSTLYDLPDLKNPTNMYLIEGDIAFIMERKINKNCHEWLQIKYIRDNKPDIIKWLPSGVLKAFYG